MGVRFKGSSRGMGKARYMVMFRVSLDFGLWYC